MKLIHIVGPLLGLLPLAAALSAPNRGSAALAAVDAPYASDRRARPVVSAAQQPASATGDSAAADVPPANGGSEAAAATLPAPASLPVVVNTWSGPFSEATAAAWAALQAGRSALDAVEEGCSRCEARRCDRTVGYGGSPDESGETTLDAMVMDGDTLRAGAVADLRRCRHAAAAARLVMQHTTHTLLAGDQAAAFAAEMGLPLGSLETEESRGMHSAWLSQRCQPNFRRQVAPDPRQSCGPYRPATPQQQAQQQQQLQQAQQQQQLQQAQQQQQQLAEWPTAHAHDTIAMVVVAGGSVAAGASSNGAIHKVPGRVGDAAVPGGGAYADRSVGGCGATGDGDVHLSFLPCYQVVESMRRGLSPQQAAEDAVRRMAERVPGYTGAVVAVGIDGSHGGAAHGWERTGGQFTYSVASGASGGRVEVVAVPPLQL